MENIEIKEITDKDIPEIIEIWYQVSLKAHSFIPNQYWRDNKEQMRNIYIPMSKTYIATCGDHIVGFISLLNEYLAAIFVKTEFQGKGIGTLLINQAKNQNPMLQLKVFCKNVDSVEFYQSKGFSIKSILNDVSTGEDEYLMEWRQ